MAVDFLEESFKRDQKKSIKLLCKESDVFEKGEDFRTTPLDIAYEIDHCPSFISHGSVQHLLDSVWTGAMPIDIRWWQMILMFVCPPYIRSIPFDKNSVIKYKKVEDTYYNNRFVIIKLEPSPSLPSSSYHWNSVHENFYLLRPKEKL